MFPQPAGSHLLPIVHYARQIPLPAALGGFRHGPHNCCGGLPALGDRHLHRAGVCPGVRCGPGGPARAAARQPRLRGRRAAGVAHGDGTERAWPGPELHSLLSDRQSNHPLPAGGRNLPYQHCWSAVGEYQRPGPNVCNHLWRQPTRLPTAQLSAWPKPVPLLAGGPTETHWPAWQPDPLLCRIQSCDHYTWSLAAGHHLGLCCHPCPHHRPLHSRPDSAGHHTDERPCGVRCASFGERGAAGAGSWAAVGPVRHPTGLPFGLGRPAVCL
mmetsp:Transcript_29773/g.53497  ORF Transcript_29773/g.53497 Transcript_29773/m.53497 type:complete len:270 (+) Transcript_29773:1435-2244(+)